MNTLRYRFASSAEAPLLARLNAQLIATGADFGPASLPQLEQRMRAWLDGGADHAVLFEDGRGRVLAYALFHEDAAEIYLRQFLVLDAARHGGVGRRAFALLRGQIWSRAKRLTLEVLCNNEAGLRFWHELGYRDCAVTLEIPAPASAPTPKPVQAGRRRLGGAAALLLASLAAMPAAARSLPDETPPARLLPVSFQPARRDTPALASAWPALTPPAPAIAPGSDDPDAAQLLALHASGGRCADPVTRQAWTMARAYGLEPAWVIALIEAESTCRANAVSPAGALGLMQLMPAAGAREAWRLIYGAELPPGTALRDPQLNIRLGVVYLRQLHRHYQAVGSDAARRLLAVAAYNCGTGLLDAALPPESAAWDDAAAQSWIARHVPRETRRYLSRVRRLAARYAVALQQVRPAP